MTPVVPPPLALVGSNFTSAFHVKTVVAGSPPLRCATTGRSGMEGEVCGGTRRNLEGGGLARLVGGVSNCQGNRLDSCRLVSIGTLDIGRKLFATLCDRDRECLGPVGVYCFIESRPLDDQVLNFGSFIGRLVVRGIEIDFEGDGLPSLDVPQRDGHGS